MNWRRTTIRTSTVFLVGVLSYALGETVSLLVARGLELEPEVVPTAEPTSRSPQQIEQKSLSAYADILDKNIFKAARSSPKPPSDQPDNTDATSDATSALSTYQITLTGTFVAGIQSSATIIGNNDSEEKLYHLDECVPEVDKQRRPPCGPEQARLKRVDHEDITLMRNGEALQVSLHRDPLEANLTENRPQSAVETNGSGAADRRQEARERLRAERQRRRPVQAANTATAGQTSTQTFPFNQKGNNYEYRVPNAEVTQAFENFSEIVGQAAAVPIIENGEPQGFELRKIRPGSIFERLGLRNNDLIQGVNGNSITTADQALRLFTVFRNEREIVLDVKRGGQSIQLAYSVE